MNKWTVGRPAREGEDTKECMCWNIMLQTIVLPRTEVRNEIITTVSIHTKSLEGVCFDVCACVCVRLRAYARSHSPESTLKGRRKNMTYF